MIQIDESGWGSLLGGVSIGLYNTETKKFFAKTIPVRYFQKLSFKKQKYLDEARKIVMTGIFAMGIPMKVVICRGFALKKARFALKAVPYEEFDITEGEIGPPLQRLLEGHFAKHLKRLGVPDKSGGAHRLSFNDQLDWIKEDPKRAKYVKTGWKRWQEKYSKDILK